MPTRFYAAAIAALTLMFAGYAHAGGIGVNQLANPGFTDPDASGGDVGCPTGWDCFGDVFTTAALGNNTPQAVKMFGPFGSGSFGLGAGLGQTFAASAGQTWEASAFGNNTLDPLQGDNIGLLGLVYDNDADSTNGDLGGFLASYDAMTPEGWIFYSASGVAPAGTNFVSIFLTHIQLSDPSLGGSAFWDDASLSLIPIPAAGWLMLSGLGALIGFRRKTA